MLARFGGHGENILNFGDQNHKFMGIGTIVGYAIIVPAILCTYLMGATLTFLVKKLYWDSLLIYSGAQKRIKMTRFMK